MEICAVLIIIGVLLIVDGLFGFIKKIGFPLRPDISAPLGFILIVLGIILNSSGIC